MFRDPHEHRAHNRTVTARLREAALRRCGVIRDPDTEGFWCARFTQLMRNRLEMGRFRYGPLSVGRFDSVSSAIRRLETYRDADGNLEHLVDAANLCLVEWIKARLGLSEHPSPRWAPTDDGRHSEVIE